MSDNFLYNEPSSGISFGSTTDASGVHYQKVTLAGPSGLEIYDPTYGYPVDVKRLTGTVTITNSGPANSSVSVLNHSTTNQTLLSANSNRKGASIYSQTENTDVYIKLGTTASSGSYSLILGPSELYELPYPAYTGRIDCLSTSPSGILFITELT